MSVISVDTVTDQDSSQSDHPDVERSGIAGTILGTISGLGMLTLKHAGSLSQAQQRAVLFLVDKINYSD